ncbi:MAG: antitoxin [Actinobacteria bacterium]|nr:antitoxin [Actinomycetota bacterium]
MDIVEQIKDAVADHSDTVKQGIDSVGDAVDNVTGGKFEAQVDQAQDFLKDQVNNLS